MRALDPSTHRGLWAAVPTPWTDGGRLDAGSLRENCRRLAAAGADGIYTTDSDGEFYAIEAAEFAELATAFARALDGLHVDAAMGVTWVHTRGVVERTRAACDAGIPNVHVAFPFFMPPARPDVDRFFADLASAVPEARWVHYAHPACGPSLTAADYARLAGQFPRQFIGTKLATGSLAELTEVLDGAPGLGHCVVDATLAVGMQLGAAGCCSYWFNTLPRWHRAYMDGCCRGDWEFARACHFKLSRWENRHVAPLRAVGHRHGILGKTRAALSGFLRDSGVTRPPYYPVADDLQRQLREAFESFWAEEIAAERFAGVAPA